MGDVKVVVTGASGVIGRQAIPALVAAGHDVVAVVKRSAKGRSGVEGLEALGAAAVTADLFDQATLEEAFSGADAVVNLAARSPNAFRNNQRGSWRRQSRLRTEGVETITAAAQAVGVRRLVQQSLSLVYADNADEWITEQSPVEITETTEPIAVGEACVQDFTGGLRVGVLLRFGEVIGTDAGTRWLLRAAAHGRPVGIGEPDNWAHVVHEEDLGSAIVAALVAPAGIYNVGAEPVTRRELADGYAAAAGSDAGGFQGPLARWLASSRVEPLTRSLRVCSEYFTAQTGWTPMRPEFDTTWFDRAKELELATS